MFGDRGRLVADYLGHDVGGHPLGQALGYVGMLPSMVCLPELTPISHLMHPSLHPNPCERCETIG
jgi:hypothetical protein